MNFVETYDTISYIVAMKVTALIPNDLIKEITASANGKNLTESLIIALREWNSLQKIKKCKDQIRKSPLSFTKTFSAQKLRELNRKS